MQLSDIHSHSAAVPLHTLPQHPAKSHLYHTLTRSFIPVRVRNQAEEEEFRRRMMAKFAEEDRIEQLNAQKRRMKQLEHQRAVQVDEGSNQHMTL